MTSRDILLTNLQILNPFVRNAFFFYPWNYVEKATYKTNKDEQG